MASGAWSSTANADIKKKSLLVKIKTSRKKLFVLREESSNGPARLEYYDSEKKFKAGVSPKRCIVLKNCLSINGKTDSRHRHAIFLYTKDDCFGLAFDNESDQQDWLTTMLELRSQVQEDNTLTKPLFEHIWVVDLKSKGLSSRTCLPSGPYHLCLTNTEISLIRLNHDDQPIVLPLDCIRRCGHSHDFFFIELGRSALTGAGELWLQVEDAVISQNMHEAILNAMRNNSPIGIEPYRVRTRSNAEHVKKRPSLYGSVSSNTGGHIPKRSQSISVHKEQQSPSLHRISGISVPVSGSVHSESNYGRLDSSMMTSSIDELDAGYPSSGSTRSMTPDDKIEEESDYFSMNPQQSLDLDAIRLPPDGAASDYLVFKPGDAHSDYMSMPGNSNTSASSARSQSSLPEMDMGDRKSAINRSSTIATTGLRRGQTSLPASTGSEYMEMSTQSQSTNLTVKTSSSSVEMRKSTESATTAVSRRSTTSGTRNSAASGSDVATAKSANEDGYMDMKIGSHPSSGAVLDEATQVNSGSVSSVISATSGTVSSAVSSRSGIAFEHEMGFHSLSRLPELYADGYMEMSPPRAFIMPHRSNNIGMRLDVVHSYLRDDDSGKMTSSDVGDTQDFPKRAYSVGSKPEPGKAFTSGSYVDMSGTYGTAVTGIRWSVKNDTERSCSAPHLNEDAGSQGLNSAIQGTTAAVAAEGGDLFMELDFNRKGTEVKEFRDRASSGGSKDLKKTLSYSAKDALARITFFRPMTGSGGLPTDPSERRPRTSTICQESLRPRTSSFGANVDDSRPRSSSGGNARLRDVFGHETALGAHRLGLKSKAFSSGAKQFSVESSVDSLNAGADYTDMFPGVVSTNSRGVFSTRAAPDSDEYIPMQLGETVSSNVSEYVPMRPGENTVTTSNTAPTVSDYMIMGHGVGLRKDTLKLSSEVLPQRLNDTSSVSNISNYMSMQPGETAVTTNKIEDLAVTNNSDYMPMQPGEVAMTTSKTVSDYMPMGATGVVRRESHKPTACDLSSTLVAPASQTGFTGLTRKLSGSVLPDRVNSIREELGTMRMPFELEAGLSSLHYAAPNQDCTEASSTSRTQNSTSSYFMMGGSTSSSEISYAALDLGRHRTGNETSTMPVSISRTSTTLGSIGRRGSDSGNRCSHVYAEIDFANDKLRPPTTSCAEK